MGKRRTGRRRGREPGRDRTRGRRRLPVAPRSDIDELDDEELAEQEEEEQDDAETADEMDTELPDDPDVDDAETGIADEFSTTPLDDGPSTAPADEIDADDLPPHFDDLPAITFYPERDGSAGYALSVYQTARHWEWNDGLARLLFDRANGLWEELVRLRAGAEKLPQNAIQDYVPIDRGPAKSTLADMLRTTILSFNGDYIPAINFFRENVERTESGRLRARDLLRFGCERTEAVRRLREETGAKRTTVIGWVNWAAENLETDEQGSAT